MNTVREGPLFSIVTPVYNTPLEVLAATIRSVTTQTCEDWELILVDDASTAPQVVETLREESARDPRIHVVERATNGHIVAASNDGIAAARGEFIALLDHDDLLTVDALEAMRSAIQENPEADYLYSDEDKVDESGRFYDTFRKPPWSPERLRGQMYTAHLSVLRTSLVREVGGFHEGFDGSQDHDLALRVTERARQVVHVPRVLYHWGVVAGSVAKEGGAAKPYAWSAGRNAVQAHMDRLGIEAGVEYGPVPGTYQIQRSLSHGVKVSVVIPTRGTDGLVWGERRCFVVEAVRSVLRRGGHANLELVVVHDEGTPAAVLEQLRADAGDLVRLVPYNKPFNFSEKCNLGVLASDGDVVLLLNDDVELASDNFIPNLVAPLFEEGIGLTGARLIYPDGTLQHAGLVFYGRHLSHMYYKRPSDEPGPFNALAINRECSGLTGACIAVKRSTYDEVGGMTEALPANYNDVDFSFKIGFLGLRRIWVANATAYHFESKTREPVVHAWEYQIIHERWATPERDSYAPDFVDTTPRSRPRKLQAKRGVRRTPGRRSV